MIPTISLKPVLDTALMTKHCQASMPLNNCQEAELTGSLALGVDHVLGWWYAIADEEVIYVLEACLV